MNNKGGMDYEEFLKYFNNSLVLLYPDVKDESGRSVMLKVDSVTRSLNSNIFAYARNLGFIIYTGVQNTTAVTQETDQNYGPFKTKCIENLNKFSDATIIHNYYTTLQPWMVGIILFSSIDPESKVDLNTQFSSWASCGADPCTRACLDGHN